MTHREMIVIGGGPAGAATAIRAARLGIAVTVFEKGDHGRDKVCGDGLTPRAVGALNDLDIELQEAHQIQGLRMIAGTKTRELDWPETSRFPSHGAVWPRRQLDAALMDAAANAGAELIYNTEVLPELDAEGRCIGVSTPTGKWTADLVVLAAGAQGKAARILGAERDPNEPFGLAIRTYAETPRHADAHIEACLTLQDENGVAVPGGRLRRAQSFFGIARTSSRSILASMKPSESMETSTPSVQRMASFGSAFWSLSNRPVVIRRGNSSSESSGA